MAQFDMTLLSPFAARFMENTALTRAERAEVLRIAQGFAVKDSAAAAGISPETVRARRKRIYRKLGVPGSNKLISTLLGASLDMLARGAQVDAARPPAPEVKPDALGDALAQ
jgi:DNA-binding CsgD family transcriptional regulator